MRSNLAPLSILYRCLLPCRLQIYASYANVAVDEEWQNRRCTTRNYGDASEHKRKMAPKKKRYCNRISIATNFFPTGLLNLVERQNQTRQILVSRSVGKPSKLSTYQRKPVSSNSLNLIDMIHSIASVIYDRHHSIRDRVFTNAQISRAGGLSELKR